MQKKCYRSGKKIGGDFIIFIFLKKCLILTKHFRALRGHTRNYMDDTCKVADNLSASHNVKYGLKSRKKLGGGVENCEKKLGLINK